MTTAPDQTPATDRYIRLPEVLHLVPIARATVWQWVASGRFPQPVRLGSRCTVWRLSEVMSWMEAQR